VRKITSCLWRPRSIPALISTRAATIHAWIRRSPPPEKTRNTLPAAGFDGWLNVSRSSIQDPSRCSISAVEPALRLPSYSPNCAVRAWWASIRRPRALRTLTRHTRARRPNSSRCETFSVLTNSTASIATAFSITSRSPKDQALRIWFDPHFAPAGSSPSGRTIPGTPALGT